VKAFNNIIFYFPHHNVGGVSLLFLRVAKALSSELNIYVVDYSDGFMAKNLPEGVRLIRIDRGDLYPCNSLFIFQSFLPWRFPYLDKIDSTSKIFFWNLHPHNFDPAIFNENSNFLLWRIIAVAINTLAFHRRKKIRAIVSELISKDGLAFMDRENLSRTEQFLGKKLVISEFLPVASPRLERRMSSVRKKDYLSLAWVGRLADFKYRSLEHLIFRLNNLTDLDCKVKLSIIGDGDFRRKLELQATKLSSAKLKVDFLGELVSEDLHRQLRENVDIVFAMGTSALEAASIGIPTFLVDYSFSKISGNYKFKLIYENSGFCLGEKITAESYESHCSLSKAIKEVLSNYDTESRKCFSYWEKNFSVEEISKKLLNHCYLTTATFDGFNKKEFFKSDRLGYLMRSFGWSIRGRASKKIVGFRNDC